MRILFALLLSVSAAFANPARAEEFDYYVLALSWSPNWCALEGDAKQADQCHKRHDYGWVLHGLWPQYERGWPSYCKTSERPPSRTMTSSMVGLMGSSGLAWHQWNKHGTCSGLSAENYYALARLAYTRINRPEILRKLPRRLNLPARVVEDAFLEANPSLAQDQITITCKSGYIQEARICLTRDLEPRKCGYDVIRDCSLKNAILTPVR